MRSCSFYHPPEEHAFIRQTQSAAGYGHGNGTVPQHHSPPNGHHGRPAPPSDHGVEGKHHQPPRWRPHHRNKKKKYSKRTAWTEAEELELLQYAQKHNIHGHWISAQHYHQITNKFGRRIEDIKSCLIRLQHSAKFQAKGQPVVDQENVMRRNTLSPSRGGQITQYHEAAMPALAPPREQWRGERPFTDSEDEYISSFVRDRNIGTDQDITFQHVEEIKQRLGRSLQEIKQRVLWLRKEGKLTPSVKRENVSPPNTNYRAPLPAEIVRNPSPGHFVRGGNAPALSPRSDANPLPAEIVPSVPMTHFDFVPPGYPQSGPHGAYSVTPSPKDAELHCAMMSGNDYSVIPQPQPPPTSQRLPALISDIKITDPRIRESAPAPPPPPPPPPRPRRGPSPPLRVPKNSTHSVVRYKVPKMPKVLPVAASSPKNNRKRKYEEMASAADPGLSTESERKMEILDLSLSLSDRLHEGSLLLEGIKSRISEDPLIQKSFIDSLKKQIAFVRKANREMLDFQTLHKEQMTRPRPQQRGSLKKMKIEKDDVH